MRFVLILWALPLGLFWSWYFLSANDINFGFVFLTQEVNELVFRLYGQVLGIDPETIPPLVAKACLLDSLLILAILAFRRRKILTPVCGMHGRVMAARDRPRAPEACRERPAG